MSVIENPETLKQQNNNVISNLGIRIPIWQTEYVVHPAKGYDSERKKAFIGGENGELVSNLIVKNIQKGTPFQWESMPGLIVPEIHAFTPSLERAFYIYLKRKYEGPSMIEKAKKLRR
jgi:hypothetical protein